MILRQPEHDDKRGYITESATDGQYLSPERLSPEIILTANGHRSIQDRCHLVEYGLVSDAKLSVCRTVVLPGLIVSK
jgi:hypothetical protein